MRTCLLTVAILLLGAAGVAHADTLSRVDADTLLYDADPGETNRVFVSTDSNGVHVIDTGATVTAGAGCTATTPNEGFCAATVKKQAATQLQINTGDQDDYVNILPGTLNLAIVDGGTGEDELIGGGARSGNWLEGGPGADILEGRATADYHRRTSPVTVTVGDDLANDGEAGEGDFVSSGIIAVFGGEAGDDLTILNSPGVQERTELEGGDGADHLSILRYPFGGYILGGVGPDVIHQEAKNGLVYGSNGDDLIFGGEGPQSLEGAGGDDTLRGLGGNDYLFGNRGADDLILGSGKDNAAGGHGPDTIFARDGQRDVLSGGPGKTDRARVDPGLDHVFDVEETF